MENKKENKLSNSSAIILGAIIIGVSIIIGMPRMGSTQTSAIDPEKIFQGRQLAANEMLMGSKDDSVIFLTYSDTECPFCKLFNDDVMSQIKVNYKGKIGLAYRKYPLPMHPLATNESIAALCAREQGGVEVYEAYTQAIFQKTKSNNNFDLNEIPKIANSLKLDMDKFNKCLQSSDIKAILQADITDGNNIGVEGTPYSLVMIKRGNDYQIVSRINGARDYQYVSKAIDLALKYK